MKSKKTTLRKTRDHAGTARGADAPARAGRGSSRQLRTWLQLAHLRYEKCELAEARVAFSMALQAARRARDLRGMMEALSGLLRCAGEALDAEEMRKRERELDRMMAEHPRQVPPMAWYCKGAIARHRDEAFVAQRHFLRYVRAAREEIQGASGSEALREEALAKGWTMLAVLLRQRGKPARARLLAGKLLRRYESGEMRGVHGILYLLMGNIQEAERDFAGALEWYQKAHARFLAEHNWYYHLYVLYGYARLSRLQRNYAQAYWYIDLIDKAAAGREFGLLRREVALERSRLEKDAVDLLVDSRRCLVRTRAGGQVSLGKQYVLLHILEALSLAHSKGGADSERGLSKAEIIRHVWKESYRPEAHDNKLYYNINRLRKLIEPDIRNPQYLLNWKEGYRLAPGLKIHFIGGTQ